MYRLLISGCAVTCNTLDELATAIATSRAANAARDATIVRALLETPTVPYVAVGAPHGLSLGAVYRIGARYLGASLPPRRRGRPPNTQAEDAAWRLVHEEKLTLVTAGQRLGVTRQYVQQLLRRREGRLGCEPRAYAAERAARDKTVVEAFRRSPRPTYAQIAAEVNVSPRTVGHIAKAAGITRQPGRPPLTEVQPKPEA